MPGIEFGASQDVRSLLVPIDGQFPTTKPNMQITLERNLTELTILDYEARTIYLLSALILLTNFLVG